MSKWSDLFERFVTVVMMKSVFLLTIFNLKSRRSVVYSIVPASLSRNDDGDGDVREFH